MYDWFIALLKSTSTKTAFVLFFVAVAYIFLPENVLIKLGTPRSSDLMPYAGLVFLGGGGWSLYWLFNFFGPALERQRNIWSFRKETNWHLERLGVDEKDCLREFIQTNKTTLNLAIPNGTADALCKKNILYKPSNITMTNPSYPHAYYSLHGLAKDLIIKKKIIELQPHS